MSNFEENTPVQSELNNDHSTSENSISVPELSTTQPIQPQVAQLSGPGFLGPLPVPNPPSATSATSSSPPKTLWMGDLDPFSDEESVRKLWGQMGKRVLVKLIKAKKGTPAATLNTGHAGYCFIEFETYDDAKAALSLNGSQILGTNRSFRLNWASSATLSAPVPQSPEYSLFVGDLSPSTTEAHLLALFQAHFKSVKTVRVMTDPITGTSRCFGFVRFSDAKERERALTDMSGIWCAGRPLRVALATPRNTMMNSNNNPQALAMFPGGQPPPNQFQTTSFNQFQSNPMPAGPNVGTTNDVLLYPFGQMPPPLTYYHPDQQLVPPPGSQPGASHQQGGAAFAPAGTTGVSGAAPGSMSLAVEGGPTSIPFSDPNNTTVFVGGLASGATEHTLVQLFSPFGNILHVKIPAGKGCGFIRFEKREDAESAIAGMQGFPILSSRVRLSWGRQQNQQRLQLAALAMGAHPVGPGMTNAQAPPGPPPPNMNSNTGLMPQPSGFSSDDVLQGITSDLNEFSFDSNQIPQGPPGAHAAHAVQPIPNGGYATNQPLPNSNPYYLPKTSGFANSNAQFDNGYHHNHHHNSQQQEVNAYSIKAARPTNATTTPTTTNSTAQSQAPNSKDEDDASSIRTSNNSTNGTISNDATTNTASNADHSHSLGGSLSDTNDATTNSGGNGAQNNEGSKLQEMYRAAVVGNLGSLN